jgi:hypothetical protein
MAIRPVELYPGQTDAGDPTGYPYGKAQNQSIVGDGTGTPLEAAWMNDLWGFLQALLRQAEITPSGTPDKVGASDYLIALATLIAEPTNTISPRITALENMVATRTRTKRFAFGDGLGAAQNPAVSGGYNYFSTVAHSITMYDPTSSWATKLVWNERIRLPVGSTLLGWRARISRPIRNDSVMTAVLRRSGEQQYEAPFTAGSITNVGSVQTATEAGTNILAQVGLNEVVTTDRHLSIQIELSAPDNSSEMTASLHSYELTWIQPVLGDWW